MHTVWKAHPDRLLRALLSPEEAAGASLLQWLYNTLARSIPWGGEGWRAAEPSVDSWTRAWTLAPGAAWHAPSGSPSISPAQPVSLCIEKL